MKAIIYASILVPILLLSISLIILINLNNLSVPEGEVEEHVIAIENEKVSLSCDLDSDCQLIDKNLGFSCCWTDVCKSLDYSLESYIAVNKNSFQELKAGNCPSAEECGPAPGCPMSIINDNFTAKCLDNVCQKAPLIRPPAPADKTPPNLFSPEASPGALTKNKQPIITFSTTDHESGISHYQVRVDSKAYSTQTSPYKLLPQTDGTHTVTVKAVNNVGLYREEAVSIYIDATSPAISNCGPPAGKTDEPTITCTVTEENLDACKMDISDKPYNSMQWSCSLSFNSILCPRKGKRQELNTSQEYYIKCQDLASNIGSKIRNYYYSPTADSPPEASDFNPSHNSRINNPAPLITFNIDKPGDCLAYQQDLSYDEILLKPDRIACGGNYPNKIECQMPNLVSDGEKNIYISCNDKINNKDTKDSNTDIVYVLDTKPPTISSTGPKEMQNTTRVILTADTDENSYCRHSTTDIGYDSMTVQFEEGENSKFHLAQISAEEGSNTYYISCTDGLNPMPSASSLTFTIDTQTPSYFWNKPLADSYYNEGDAILVDVTVTELGSGITGGANCNPKIDLSSDSFTGSATYDSVTSKCAGTLTLNKTPELQPQYFIFGDEGANPGIADYYSSLGTTWTKIWGVRWSRIEPEAPTLDVHQYDWSLLDEYISAYQNAGYKNFHLALDPNVEWATEPAPSSVPGNMIFKIASPLKPGQEQNYTDWIKALVERYDYDGKEDMPGLLRPITHFEVLSEAQHNGYFWPGDLDREQEYEKLLRLAYQAAKQANPNAKIILSGITMEGVVDGNPSGQVMKERLLSFEDKFPEQLSFIKESLKMTDYYDEIEIHYLSDWQSLYAFVDWLRNNQSVDKPIWAGDAFPIHMVYPTTHQIAPDYYPRGEELFAAIDRVMTGAPLGQDQIVYDWYEKELAQSLVKKVVLAAHLELKGIMMGNTYDYLEWRNLPSHLKSITWMGLVDVLKEGSKITVSQPRQGFRAYQDLITNIEEFAAVQRITTEENTYIYEFIMPNHSKIYVAWYDDNIWECPVYCDIEQEAQKQTILPNGQKIILNETPVIVQASTSTFRAHQLTVEVSDKIGNSQASPQRQIQIKSIE